MKKKIFFLRHFNDIDNIVPVIYYLLEKKNYKVDIVIYSLHYDFRGNQLLRFLQEKYQDRVLITWIGEALNYPYMITKNRLIRLSNYAVRRLTGLPTLEQAIKVGKKKEIITDFLSNILHSEDEIPTQVLFDQNRTSVISGLISSLRELGIETIKSLPVSPWINMNVLRQVDFIELDAEVFKKKHDYSGFDRIGQVDPYYSQSLEEFFQCLGEKSPFDGKIELLGSLRYSREWLDVLNSEIMKPYLPPGIPKGDKPTVLILPSHPKNNSFWDEYHRTLQFLSQFDRFDFIIKPHTRYDTKYRSLPPNMKLDRSSSTSQLIDWADIILYWSTSVALEGFQKGKKMICLDFLNGNYSSYKKFNVTYLCNSRDDLMKILLKHSESENEPNNQGIIKNIIYHGSDDDIISRYLTYIEE